MAKTLAKNLLYIDKEGKEYFRKNEEVFFNQTNMGNWLSYPDEDAEDYGIDFAVIVYESTNGCSDEIQFFSEYDFRDRKIPCSLFYRIAVEEIENLIKKVGKNIQWHSYLASFQADKSEETIEALKEIASLGAKVKIGNLQCYQNFIYDGKSYMKWENLKNLSNILVDVR